MAHKIILSADSTCDIGEELQAKYSIQFFNFHIQIGDETYVDRLEISPSQIYSAWHDKKILPKTAAITPTDYKNFFKKWVLDGYDVLHINLGSGLSSAYQNCNIVANELGHIYPFDSASLSTGSGLLVLQAAKMIKAGLNISEIIQKLEKLKEKISASFIVDKLDFLAAGGRCNSLLAFGANLLKIRPQILVDNKNQGKMDVGKKYRGSMEKVIENYIHDELTTAQTPDLDRIFITHSGSPASDIELAKNEIKKYHNFKNITVTSASGTICSHCGPRTLGILFLNL